MPAGKTLAANEQALASDIMSMLNYGIAASIPATADVVRDSFYWETDTKILKQEHNGTWVETARGEAVIRLASLAGRAHGDLSDAPTNAHHTKYTDANARAAAVEDAAYGAGWNGDTTHAPSQNAVYDKIESLIGGATVKIKTSDEIVNNNETLQNDNDLVLAVGANDVWWITVVFLPYSPTTTPEIDYLWAVPSGGSVRRKESLSVDNSAGFTDGTVSDRLNVSAAAANEGILYYFIYRGGGTSGNLQLEWAQGVATSEDTKLLTGTFMVCQQLV